ncbi:MAG: alpha/beta hydrolase [Bacteroidota bacterium]
MLKKLLLLVAIVLLAYLGLAYYFSNLVIHPPRRTNPEVKGLMQVRAGIDIDTFRQKMPAGETFIANSLADETELIGTYFAQDSSQCAVIISHGYGSTRLSMMKYAPIWYDCGCDVVVYDHRAHGESAGRFGTGGTLEALDLHGVTDWTVEKTGLTRQQIGWMGESWGGSAVLQAGATGEDVAFIIAESAFQDWETAVFERAQITYGGWIAWMKPAVFTIASWRIGTDAWEASPLKKAPSIEEPTLVLHSQADAETASEQSVNVAAALPQESSRFHHLDWGAKHGNNVFTKPAEYEELLMDFVADYVPDWLVCSAGEEDSMESLPTLEAAVDQGLEWE